MLRVLSGARHGWIGRFPLPSDFLDAMAALQEALPWRTSDGEAGAS
jgi:hypothetical protein